MSRVGKLPIAVPNGVTITVDPQEITVSGPKGVLKRAMMTSLNLQQADNVLTVVRQSEDQGVRARHGLMRSLIQNMVIGVTQGFSKKLEVNGVGFRVVQQGADLKLNLDR